MAEKSKRIAIFPGTFDPMTLGHLDLIERSAALFERLIVAVAQNQRKRPTYDFDARIKMAQLTLNHIENASVQGFSNLLVDFAQEVGAGVIVRGLRLVSDFEYEFQLSNMNRHLACDIETLFLTPSAEKFSFVSSSLVREVLFYKGDVSSFVHKDIIAYL